MRIKPDWQTYLHDLRQQEADILFGNCPVGLFDRALELGAGDSYLSQILAGYSKSLLCTEINEDRLCPLDLPNVEYKIMDAEKVDETLEDHTFDFIFSSNLLEHLPNADRALAGTHRLLTDDGLAIHVLPNRTWKAATVLCFMPNKIVKTMDKLLAGRLGVPFGCLQPPGEAGNAYFFRKIKIRLFPPRITRRSIVRSTRCFSFPR